MSEEGWRGIKSGEEPMESSDLFRTLTDEEYAAVPVPTREEIRAALASMRRKLRESAEAPKPSPTGQGVSYR